MAKVIQKHKLSGLSGVYDVKVGKADPTARMHRDFSKTGKAVAASQKRDFDDEKAIARRLGLFGL